MGGKINKGKSSLNQGTRTAANSAADRDRRKVSKSGGNTDSRSSAASADNKRRSISNTDGGKNYDWIASLAKQSTLESSSSSSAIPSKDDRKRKREAKKARRLDQKRQREGQQQEHLRVKGDPTSSGSRREIMAATSRVGQRKHASEISKGRIQRIADMVQTLRRVYIAQYNNEDDEEDNNSDNSNSDERRIRKRPRSYTPPAPGIKKRRIGRWTAESIQPRSSDYSGIGLARDSLYIEFSDPSCIPKLEEEFQEHVPGFFGKQRTKAMKRQMDGNMLWRQLANNKNSMSKKMKSMSPDERVQAMLDAGMI
jgi:hypothetical protein